MPDETVQAAPNRRASLAVMPFVDLVAGPDPAPGGVAGGLTVDIITRLAKLRSMFVIARGSVFALAERGLSPEEAGRKLDVDFVASGSVRSDGGRIAVSIELVHVPTAHIVWAETFEHPASALLAVNDEIGNRIVSCIANEIEIVERNRAVLKPPNSLDAWEACHRGLWHMYRFTQADNERAQHFLRLSIDKDPTFARAHAALSFTHWQSAFQRWSDVAVERERAYRAAGESLMADEQDPAAHWAMGRALWLWGRHDESVAELSRAVDLSPNFALGHYALSFVSAQSGDPAAAIRASDHSRHLSPYDPLLFGMLGTRALAHVRLGQFEDAATWAVKAAARPNAHANIVAIAAHCLALAGRVDEARTVVAQLRGTLPAYSTDHFLTVFQFAPDAEALFRRAGRIAGLL
jgi:TolB-like protein